MQVQKIILSLLKIPFLTTFSRFFQMHSYSSYSCFLLVLLFIISAKSNTTHNLLLNNYKFFIKVNYFFVNVVKKLNSKVAVLFCSNKLSSFKSLFPSKIVFILENFSGVNISKFSVFKFF